LALIDEGPCPGGEVGARYARGPRGEAYVYKWLEGHSMAWATALVEHVEHLRANGYPAPGYLTPFELDGSVLLVQQRARGQWSDDIDSSLLTELLSVNDRQSGLGQPGNTWRDYIVMTLTEGADGYCLHQTLRDGGRESASVLGWITSVGRSVHTLPQADLVHLDYHHRNVLQADDGAVTVVDLEGCQPGDRTFDLVTLGIYLDDARTPPSSEPAVWAKAVQLAPPENLRAYVAHMALRRLDWTMRFHPEDLDRALTVVHDYMGRVG
jgi:hypothetical protein